MTSMIRMITVVDQLFQEGLWRNNSRARILGSTRLRADAKSPLVRLLWTILR